MIVKNNKFQKEWQNATKPLKLWTGFLTLIGSQNRSKIQLKSFGTDKPMAQAMREREAAGGQRKYRYCLVRVRFPDGCILQGTFAGRSGRQMVQYIILSNTVFLAFHHGFSHFFRSEKKKK
jgi:hypothetical protein